MIQAIFALSEILENGGSVEFGPYFPLGQHFLQPGEVSNERYPISDIALPKPFNLGLTHESAHPFYTHEVEVGTYRILPRFCLFDHRSPDLDIVLRTYQRGEQSVVLCR
jgi:hypothetical protein